MKRIYFILLFFVSVSMGQAQERTVASYPKVEMEWVEYDFGELDRRAGKVGAELRVKNSGDAPLVIIGAEVSCSCVAVDYPRRPIEAGATGVIKITLNPKKESGVFHKYVRIEANTEVGRHMVVVKGVVVE